VWQIVLDRQRLAAALEATLARLGLERREAPVPSLAEYLAQKERERGGDDDDTEPETVDGRAEDGSPAALTHSRGGRGGGEGSGDEWDALRGMRDADGPSASVAAVLLNGLSAAAFWRRRLGVTA
jgi:hypothetical protein